MPSVSLTTEQRQHLGQRARVQRHAVVKLGTCATVADEIRAIGCWLSRVHTPEPSNEALPLSDHEKLCVEVFARHFGLLGEAKTSLQTIAMACGIPVEQGQELVADMMSRATQVSFHTPRLDMLERRAVKYLPTNVAILDARLREYLGGELSFQSVSRFARNVLRRPFISRANSAVSPLDKRVKAALHKSASQEVAQVARQHVEKILHHSDAAHLYVVATAVSQELGYAVPLADLVAALQIPRFEWLRESDGWFWYSGHASVVMLVTAKILSVADQCIEVGDIHQALARYRQCLYGAAEPCPYTLELPCTVVGEIFKRFMGVTVAQFDDLGASRRFDPKTCLYATEQELLEVFIQFKGVAAHQELQAKLVGSGQMSDETLALLLETSPILHPLESGIYTLRGRTISVSGLARAQSAVQRHEGRPL